MSGDEITAAAAAADSIVGSMIEKAVAVDLCDGPTRPQDEPRAPADWRQTRAVVLHRDGYRCAKCGQEATAADHKWPKAKGGRDKLSNLQALCQRCNARKGDTLLLKHITSDRLDDAISYELSKAVDCIRIAARWWTLSERVVGRTMTIDEMALEADATTKPDDAALELALSTVREVLEVES